MAKGKKKKRLPSQQKYDQSHPTVSARLPVELYGRFMDYLKVTKQSVADFIKGHLDVEEAQVEARVEELARRQNNLGVQIINGERQIRDLDEQVKKRKQELARPVEEERARLRREVDGWYQQERKRFERSRAYNETRLESLRSEVKQEKEQLRKVQLDLLFLEARKKTIEEQRQKWLQERENWLKQMNAATEFINSYPWMFCYQCPGAAFNQLLLNMMNTVTSLAAGGEEAEDNSRSNESPPSESQTSN
jgi:hypothetical protein